MGITLWGPGTILLSLSILSGLAVGPSIAYSQSAGDGRVRQDQLWRKPRYGDEAQEFETRPQ